MPRRHRSLLRSLSLGLPALALPLPAPAAVPGYFLEVMGYDISAELRPGEDTIRVDATLTIANHTFYPLEVIDLYLNGTAQVAGALVNGAEAAFENIGSRGDPVRRLTITLSPPVPVSGEVSISADYAVTYFERGSGAQIEPGATHLLVESRWTPFLHEWDSEYGGDFAPARISLRVPGDEMAVMPGTLVREQREGGTALFEWESGLSVIPAFASGRYRTVALESTSETEAIGHLFEDMPASDDEAMRTLLTRAVEISGFYTALYGPLPPAPLRIAAVDRRGGYGLPRCLLLERQTFDFDGEPSRDTFEFLAHEIAHSWFPGLLRPRSVATGMPSEALASYSAALAVEHFLGPEAARAVWRGYQQDYASLDVADEPLLSQYPGSRTYGASTYKKGAFFWRALEQRLGRERLTGLLREFAQAHPFEAIPFPDLVDWFKAQAPDSDLDAFFRWWLQGTDLANVGLRGEPRVTAQGAGVHVELTLDQSGLPGTPFEIEARLADGQRVRQPFTITAGATQTVSLALPAAPVEIALDPDRWLLQSRYQDDAWPRELDAMGHYRVAARAWRRGDFAAGLEPIAQALARQPENPQFLLMAGLLLHGTGDTRGARDHLEQALEHADESDRSITRAWTLVALGRVCRELGLNDDARAHWFQVMDTGATSRAHGEAQSLMAEMDRALGLTAAPASPGR